MEAGDFAPDEQGSWRRYRVLIDQTSTMVLETDDAGNVVWISEPLAELTGREPGQLRGLPLAALVHPGDRSLLDLTLARAPRAGSAHTTLRWTVRNGRHRRMSLHLSSLPAVGGARPGLLAMLRDEQGPAAALRALATLSAANRVLVKAEDEGLLLREMCAVVARVGQYPLVWFGRPEDDESRSVAVVAAAGERTSYLDELRVSWADEPRGRGPTGRAIRTGETQVVNDFDRDPGFGPWRDVATRSGFACSAALPVRVGDDLVGALMVYADEPGSFDLTARELLDDLVADLGCGIARLRDLRRRREVEERLVESERHYRLLAENVSDVVLLSDLGLRFQWCSASVERSFGWTPEQVVGRTAADYVHPDDLPSLHEVLAGATGAGLETRLRYRFRHLDGSYRWVAAAGRQVVDDEGAVVGRVVSLHTLDD